jgi:hypothetical protein
MSAKFYVQGAKMGVQSTKFYGMSAKIGKKDDLPDCMTTPRRRAGDGTETIESVPAVAHSPPVP